MKKKPNGHPGVYWALGLLAIGFWFIPHQIIAEGALNFKENLSVLDVLMQSATVSAKGAGTLGMVILAVYYNWRKK